MQLLRLSDALETTFFFWHFHHPISLNLTRPGGPTHALMPVSLHVAATFFHDPAPEETPSHVAKLPNEA
jgi:hypothetical protein